ncbi:MAG TPA: deoxyhypusine synthase [Nitrospiraceae bacterium]|jgi:deoxyhypusine synthase|nr:deoxyhypusine synthase [Nitrospiraceae bacterium]
MSKEISKKKFLKKTIKHIDIKEFNAIPIITQFGKTAFQAKNLSRACEIYEKMLKDRSCTVILCLAGSLFSAGLKKIVYDMVENNMVDIIISTGAIIVDQDFFEALGFKHYQGSPRSNDSELFKMAVDRIYDTFIDEDDLRECDLIVGEIANGLSPKAYSSREFIMFMGEFLDTRARGEGSVVWASFKKQVPIFVPAFSDSSAGFGLVSHQWERKNAPKVTIDSVKDFLELTKIKIASKNTGLLIIGGGVPKNFAQDATVSADIIMGNASMHKYAVQITVADERDGGLSGSTLKEAHSWGKVDEGFEQMVYSEATLAFPLLASYAYHKGSWKRRTERRLNHLLEEGP